MKTVKVKCHFMVYNSVRKMIFLIYLTDLCDFVKLLSRSGNEMYGENWPLIFF